MAISEIASLRPEHHAVQGLVRNDTLVISKHLSPSETDIFAVTVEQNL